jgi:hypothetical protein
MRAHQGPERLWPNAPDDLEGERARALAIDAADAADVERRRRANGRGRYSLFTGDTGVALLLHGCLAADATFPFIGQAA